MSEATVEEAGPGVYWLDSGYWGGGVAVAIIVVDGGRAAVIEVSSVPAVDRILAALDGLGIARSSVDYVVATHVHLDHAAGAGALLERLPEARLAVHVRGVRHLVDPARLLAAAAAVYGEDTVRELYGEIVPAPAERVVAMADGARLSLAARSLQVFHTRGHANHHLCVHDERSGTVVAGDNFGLAYPELRTASGALIVPTSAPSQFDPDEAHASLDRIMACNPERVIPTHFGPVTDLAPAVSQLHDWLDRYVEIARNRLSMPPPARPAAVEADLREAYRAAAERIGRGSEAVEKLAMDTRLNAMGLCAWLARAESA